MPRGVSREAFRVGGLLRKHSPHPKLLAILAHNFGLPALGEAITRTELL